MAVKEARSPGISFSAACSDLKPVLSLHRPGKALMRPIDKLIYIHRLNATLLIFRSLVSLRASINACDHDRGPVSSSRRRSSI